MSQKNKIIDKVEEKLFSESSLSASDSILVAFSGGADSVCLLYILNAVRKKTGFLLYAAHLNHCLRGEAAEHDENFAIKFCKKLGIELFVKKEDVGFYAKEHKLSEELAGRELRYSFFNSIMEEKNIKFLATGHHADDQTETVLMHLMRGSGIDGISGMRYKREKIIRPLLGISKEEILKFCHEEKLEFCTDATNFETEYSRNKVRLEIIPKMIEINPNLSNTISRTTEILADESDFLEECVKKTYKDIIFNNSVEIEKLHKTHICLQRRLIKKMIESACGSKKDISYDYIDKVLKLAANNKTGKSINLLSGVVARIQYDKLIIEKPSLPLNFFYEVLLGKEISIPDINVKIKIECKENGDFTFSPDAKLVIRTRQNGDRIYPLGMLGTKKLKSFFIDEKVPREQRDKSLILTCNGEIALIFYCGKLFYDRRFYNKNKGNTHIEIY